MIHKARILTLIACSLVLAAILAPSASAAARSRHHATHKRCKVTRRHGRRHVTCGTVKRTRRHSPRGHTAALISPIGRRSLPRATYSGRQIVGLNADNAGWGGASTSDRLNLVTSQTNAKWYREEFRWSTIEPSRGVFDFSYYDHFMLQAAQRGLRVLPLLYETPSWDGATYDSIPSDPSAFGQFVAAVVGRYGPGGSFWTQYPNLAGSAIHYWEIWNEPYLGSGDNGDYDPGRYARLVKAAAIAGRAVDPNAKFLMAAEMQSGRDSNGNWVWWVDAMYQAVPDLNNYFDAVAVHDYGDDTRSLNPMIYGQAYDNYGHIRRIENLRSQFISHNAAGKPFWITEAGWSTCSDSPDCVSSARQASNLATLFSDIHTRWSGWVQAAFIYRYGDGSDPSSTQDAYGLTYLNGNAKPALAVFKQAVATSG